MNDLTTGSLTRHLLKTTSYMLVTMLFQTLYVLVDLYWVGRLGTEAVAAVGISGNLLFVVLAATQMLGVGTTTFVAHAVGRRDQDRANLIFNQALVLSTIVGILFLTLAMALMRSYATALSADALTREFSVQYLAWFIPSQALSFPFVAMGAALRGTGNFRPGMIVQTATVILNIVLAPVLIFGWGPAPEMGVAGAALATFLAIAIGTVWMTMYFLPDSAYITFHRQGWKPRFDLWVGMLKIGLPAGAEFALMAVYLVLVYSVSRPFGASAQAGFGIGLRVVQACFLPVVALGFAVSPVAGQNFGARQAERVKQTFRTAATIAGTAMLLLAALVWLAGDRMVEIFSADPAVIAVGRRISPRCRMELRRVGRHLRQLEHVSGDGQHDTVPDNVGISNCDHRDTCPAAGQRQRLRADLGVVHLRRRRLHSARHEPAPPPARVPHAARIRARI
jgi:putative MATE family efflux protein